METKGYLLALVIILLGTKLMGLLTERMRMPQIVGALLAGLLLGPAGFSILNETEFLRQIAELGVIFLMFHAGLETDLQELKKTGATSLLVAVCGVLLPLVGGTAVYMMFFGGNTQADLLKAVFTGVVLTATSVSISVEALKEMGKLNTPMGTVIMGAAVIDDILGILVLTIVSGFADPSTQITAVFGKIALYLVFLPLVALVISKFFRSRDNKRAYSKRTAIYLLAFALLMAYISETYFGVADITGAYFAGMMVCNIQRTREAVAEKIDVASYMFFSPIFFAGIGLKTDLSGFSAHLALFSAVLLVVAILTKMIGCAVSAKAMGFQKKEALCIGIGMISRGEVALIVAQKGQEAGVLSAEMFPAIVLIVIATTLLSPVLLRFILAEGKKEKVQTRAIPA